MPRIILAACGAFLTLAAAPAIAANYPEARRVIKLVVGFPPGGGADSLARVVSPRLAQELNGTVIVENRPGAGGIIATDAVAKSAPDGYTLYIATPGSFTIWPNLRTLPYNAEKDFSAVSLMVTMPNILVTSPNAGFKDVNDLVAKAKAGTISFASGGNGTIGQIAGEQFNILAGIKTQHIPYKGTAPALTDVMSGTVPFTFSDPSAKSLVTAGKLRVLAVTTTKRSSQFPGVPTMIEAGIPGYEVMNWYGLVAPAGVPADVIAKLNTALVKVMREPEVVKSLANSGMDATSSTPPEFNALIVNERAKWGDLIRRAKITGD
jgi:tripartite-type tricarboxylate transporter receptor subunit TctC